MEPRCSIERCLASLGERWTFLIVREAFFGATRFAEWRERLGVAPDVLTARLATLVDSGVLEKRPYQEPGQRVRESYHLTEAGRDLDVVLGALQQWGDRHAAHPDGPSILRRTADGRPVGVGFVDDRGRRVEEHEVTLQPV